MTWLLGAMIVWSVFAVGGVYVWAGVPLMVAAVLLAAFARPTPAASRDTRMLDGLLLASVAAAAVAARSAAAGGAGGLVASCRRDPLGHVPGTA